MQVLDVIQLEYRWAMFVRFRSLGGVYSLEMIFLNIMNIWVMENGNTLIPVIK